MLNDITKEIVDILRELSVEEIMDFEEKYDEQYKALKALYSAMKNKEAFIPLTILNALVSYQLTGTGEEYWWEFSKYFQEKNVKDPVSDMVDFLKSSSKNRRLTNSKIRRVLRARQVIEIVKRKEKEICGKPETLIAYLQKSYGTKQVTKTFSFAVKMLHYACRIKYGIKDPIPASIPIPQDYRVTRITSKLEGEINIVKLWNEISKKTGIPPLHIDSILWITYGMIKRGEKIKDRKLAKIYGLLSRLIS